MQVNNYDAEAGRTGGGVFNVTACSGLIAQGAANMVCPFFGAPPGVALIDRKRFRNLPRMNRLDAALFLLTF